MFTIVVYGLWAFYVALYICAVDYAVSDLRKRWKEKTHEPG
jgi:hypothetical protein